jgi:cation diffusion facilitator CzcD-associated flavoprotein CzcO
MPINASRPMLNRFTQRRQSANYTGTSSASGETPLRVGIVGAGLGGIALAVKLKKAGFDHFTVFEQSAGAGGTWHDNTYPGCQVDVPSGTYSYSFMPYDWSRRYGKQLELQRYTEDTIDRFGIRDKFRFSSRVDQAVWDEARHLYIVRTNGEEHEFNLLVSCVGLLNVPKDPDWPGMGDFQGAMFHSARWDHSIELTGKRVAVVGTGSSACQIVPELAKVVEQLYVFQREPGWIAPKPDHEYSAEERRRNFRLLRRKVSRWWGFVKHVETLGDRNVGSKRHRQLTKICLDFIESEIHDPELRKLVTPTYPVGCKRLVRDSRYYGSLNLPNVHLVPNPVSRFTRSGVIDAQGTERPVDVVVTAIGFKAADYLASLPVIGSGGLSLRDVWAGEPKAFLGITVAGFPNFFMLYGPNTNGGGSIIAQHERQAELIVKVARRMSRRHFTQIDTKRVSMADFVRWVDRKNAINFSAIHAGCNNYFLSPSGRNVTQWPLGQIAYLWRTKLMPQRAFVMRR